MQLKCKACDRRLTFYDYSTNKSEDSFEEEDLCSKCRDIIFNIDELDTHEYQHQHLTEQLEDLFA